WFMGPMRVQNAHSIQRERSRRELPRTSDENEEEDDDGFMAPMRVQTQVFTLHERSSALNLNPNLHPNRRGETPAFMAPILVPKLEVEAPDEPSSRSRRKEAHSNAECGVRSANVE